MAWFPCQRPMHGLACWRVCVRRRPDERFRLEGWLRPGDAPCPVELYVRLRFHPRTPWHQFLGPGTSVLQR